jgi:regulator of protease activity HflC (stomatin/prohibitin superfamily)
MFTNPLGSVGIFIGLLALYFITCIRVIFEYQRGVLFRLGRVISMPKGPGLIMVFWPIDRLIRVSLRTIVTEVPSQDVITRDNVSVKVSAVVYFRVVDPLKAVLEVEDYLYATNQLSQTTLRSILGQAELDELLAERDRINRHLQEVIDQQTEPWGIKVSAVEVKHVDLPDAMQRAMARQAESERERRAKVIHAEGEYQAATRLRDAAETIEDHPMAMQLRFLQTVADTRERSTMFVLPLPIDLLSSFQRKDGARDDQTAPSKPPDVPARRAAGS